MCFRLQRQAVRSSSIKPAALSKPGGKTKRAAGGQVSSISHSLKPAPLGFWLLVCLGLFSSPRCLHLILMHVSTSGLWANFGLQCPYVWQYWQYEINARAIYTTIPRMLCWYFGASSRAQCLVKGVFVTIGSSVGFFLKFGFSV